MITLIQIVLGITVLIAGRKLFWLFVGAIGFFVGISLAGLFFSSQSEVLRLMIALAAGVLGAVLALFLQKLAVGLAGFLAGGYALVALLNWLGLQLPEWIPFIVGGIIGATLVAVLFEWALIVLSAGAGAGLLVQAFGIGGGLRLALLIILFIVGVAVQIGIRSVEQRKPPAPKNVVEQ